MMLRHGVLESGDFPNITYEYIGNTDIFESISTSGRRRAQKVTSVQDCQIDSIAVYHGGGSGDMLLAVYEDIAGVPGDRLGIIAQTAINATAGWQTTPLLAPVSLLNGQNVWLAWVFEVIPGLRYITGAPGRAQSEDEWAGGMPDPFGASTTSSTIYSIYAITSVTTPQPQILSENIYDDAPTEVSVVLDEPCNGSTAGWTIKKEDISQSILSLTGSGTNTFVFTLAGAFSYEESLKISYDPVTGSTTSVATSEELEETIDKIGNNEVLLRLNFGNTSIFASTSSSTRRRAQPISVNADGVIESIAIYHGGTTGDIILAVYEDDAGAPGDRLGITAQVAMSTGAGWQTIPLITPVSVSVNDAIWLAWVYESVPGIRYEAGNPGRAQADAYWIGGMPDPFGVSTIYDTVFSIYCTVAVTGELPFIVIASAATDDPNAVTIVVSGIVSGTELGWVLKINGISATITDFVSQGDNEIVITISETMLGTDTLKVSYDADIGDIVSTTGVPLASISEYEILNNISTPVGTILNSDPTFEGGTISGIWRQSEGFAKVEPDWVADAQLSVSPTNPYKGTNSVYLRAGYSYRNEILPVESGLRGYLTGQFQFEYEYWFGFAFYLKDFTVTPSLWNHIFQCHTVPHIDPATGKVDWNTSSGYNGMGMLTTLTKYGDHYIKYATTELTEAEAYNDLPPTGATNQDVKWLKLVTTYQNQWNYVIFNFKFSIYNAGFIKAWWNGALECDITGPNIHRLDSAGEPRVPYTDFECGIYKQRDNPALREVYIDSVRFAGSDGSYALVDPSQTP